MRLKTLFNEHPEAVGESYFEHMGVAQLCRPSACGRISRAGSCSPALPVRDNRERHRETAPHPHDEPHTASFSTFRSR